MAISPPKPLVQSQLLTASAAIYYTVPANRRALISSGELYNADATATIVATLYVVPSGGSVGDATEKLKIALGPKESYIISELIGKPLAAGTTIQALADTPTKVNLDVGGTEFDITP